MLRQDWYAVVSCLKLFYPLRWRGNGLRFALECSQEATFSHSPKNSSTGSVVGGKIGTFYSIDHTILTRLYLFIHTVALWMEEIQKPPWKVSKSWEFPPINWDFFHLPLHVPNIFPAPCAFAAPPQPATGALDIARGKKTAPPELSPIQVMAVFWWMTATDFGGYYMALKLDAKKHIYHFVTKPKTDGLITEIL